MMLLSCYFTVIFLAPFAVTTMYIPAARLRQEVSRPSRVKMRAPSGASMYPRPEVMLSPAMFTASRPLAFGANLNVTEPSSFSRMSYTCQSTFLPVEFQTAAGVVVPDNDVLPEVPGKGSPIILPDFQTDTIMAV